MFIYSCMARSWYCPWTLSINTSILNINNMDSFLVFLKKSSINIFILIYKQSASFLNTSIQYISNSDSSLHIKEKNFYKHFFYRNSKIKIKVNMLKKDWIIRMMQAAGCIYCKHVHVYCTLELQQHFLLIFFYKFTYT